MLDTIQADLTAAMKARDELRVATLRGALAAIKEASVAGAVAKELDDAEIQKVLRAEMKKRADAAEAFRAGGRDDRAAREEAESDILAAYLPARLSDDELASIIDQVFADGGFSSMADMGRAMGAVNAAVAGRADGKVVADAVKARLGG
jgi:uncharacterized protein YqeY